MSEIENDYKMTKHLLQVLDQLDKKDAISNREKAIGVEDIRARTITKELLAAKRHVDLILENITEGVLELNHEGKIIYGAFREKIRNCGGLRRFRGRDSGRGV